MSKVISQTPCLFAAECGHRWIAPMEGSFACPVCGLYDGDHHLTQMEPIPGYVLGDGEWEYEIVFHAGGDQPK